MDERMVILLRWIVPVLVFIGIALLLIWLAAYHAMSPVAKKRWWPLETGVIAAWILLFSTTYSLLQARSWSSLRNLFVLVPALVFLWLFNLMSTTFCDKCGAFQISNLIPKRSCFKCGADLDGTKAPPDHRMLE